MIILKLLKCVNPYLPSGSRICCLEGNVFAVVKEYIDRAKSVKISRCLWFQQMIEDSDFDYCDLGAVHKDGCFARNV